ncbi:MAG: lysophospholipid acyltransferase family protein [Deltaproteobacteria bacterium]|nr:lysophospholipid acyltransferase family protein [Deltaproteobacteria bacterium]
MMSKELPLWYSAGQRNDLVGLPLWQQLAYAGILLLSRMVALIPWPWYGGMGRALGSLAWRMDKKHRKITLDNITASFSELSPGAARELGRRCFQNMSRVFFEVLALPWMTKSELMARIDFQDPENVTRALALGKGGFVLTAHFGDWEVLSLALAASGWPGEVIVRPLDFKPLDRFIDQLRTMNGHVTLNKNRSARGILAALHRKRLIGVLLDQNVTWQEGVFVDYFGRRACTNKGLALLALKTGSPVIPIFIVRQGDNRFRMICHPAVELIRTGDNTKDIEENTALFTKIIENMVRQYPDHWFWMHQRWKSKPYEPWPKR